MTLIERSFRERIVLVGVVAWPRGIDEVESSLDELALLVNTAGADVVDRVIQTRDRLDPATFIGRGKAEELHLLCEAVDSDTVVFDEELTPAQQRNLEKILGRTAIDRTAVILDIFAQNARSEEGRAQVELAMLRYRLPRLRGKGQSLSQQAGGIGTRGPGETKLEVDRRRIASRIAKLEVELKGLEATRHTQRKARHRTSLRSVSLVGYTNAGKSTLLNALTNSDALVENRLFATLDPRTRKLEMPGGELVLCSDTVGFVSKLPHQLVESFHSTLEVVADSDLLVHVVDSSARDPEAQMAAVRKVLGEIEADAVDELIAFNKADIVPQAAERLARHHPGSVVLSARGRTGLDELLVAIGEHLRSTDHLFDLLVPYDRGDVLAALHRFGAVIEQHDAGNGLFLSVRLDESGRRRFLSFSTNGTPPPVGPNGSNDVRADVGVRAMSNATGGFVVPVYPFDLLKSLEPVAQAHEGGMIDLSVGEPAERPTENVLQALLSDGAENNYPPSLGKPELRDAARNWITRRFGIDIERSEIAMCVGTKEFVAGVPHWLRLKDPSRDTVLYPAISYPTYEMGALLANCRAIPVPARKDGSLALETIDDDDARRSVCLWVNSPSNPTGELDDLDAAANFGRAHHIPVLSDECYAEFTWDGPPRSILSSGTAGVLAVHSISKRSNAAGLRVGFYAGDDELVHYISELRRHAGFMVPAPIQMAGIVALNDDELPALQRSRYVERLERLIAILATIGVEAHMPSGGFYLWVKVPDRYLDKVQSEMQSESDEIGDSPEWPFVRLLAEIAGVLVSPGAFYGPYGRGFVRIALVEPIDRIELIATRLEAAPSEYPQLAR